MEGGIEGELTLENWKLLVENSVDDYHIIATHTTWIQYMINSGVNMKRPKGQLLPSKGRGIDLGTEQSIRGFVYLGRQDAGWIPQPASTAMTRDRKSVV